MRGKELLSSEVALSDDDLEQLRNCLTKVDAL
jgi:hypothetical protein